MSDTNRLPYALAFSTVMAALLLSSSAKAAGTGADGVPWFTLVMGLFGGLALFLYGMERMADALKAVAGDRMRAILGHLSNNRLMGLLTGAGVTALIQSSSVTTVMLVGFVSANLMSLSQSVGVVLGSGIGTTITAQIVAFKVTKYALLLVTLGFFPLFVSKNRQVQRYGYVVMGLGLIFFGMAVMSDAMHPLRNYAPFLNLMQSMDAPFQGILIGTAFTALIQSSSASVGIIIVLALQGLISLEAGIALVLGANIGTCATAGLAAINKPREAVRVAMTHVFFKVVGVSVILPFLSGFTELVIWLSPAADATLSGQALLANVVPRQVANAHTVFNVGLAIIFLPMTTLVASLMTWIVKDRPLDDVEELIEPKYLDPILLKTPSVAMGAVRHELGRLGKRVLVMLELVLPALISGRKGDLDAVAERDEVVDRLYGQIVVYLGEISREELNGRQTAALMGLMSAANDLETVGDIVETELVSLGYRRLEENISISEPTQERIHALHQLVYQGLDQAIQAVSENDAALAQTVLAQKPLVRGEQKAAERHQAERLVVDRPQRLEAYALELDVIDRLSRTHYHTRRLAKSVNADRRATHPLGIVPRGSD